MFESFAPAFKTKSIAQVKQDSQSSGAKLERVLTSWDVFIFGVGAIVGAGIFVLSGIAAAQYAGPAIVISFAIAAITCIPVALSFAEIASMIPVAGSVYTYTYVTFGKILAFIIAWDLMLEYTLGAGAVASGFSAYARSMLEAYGVNLPNFLTNIDLVAVLIIWTIALLLMLGASQSKNLANILVLVQVTVIGAFIWIGVPHVEFLNYQDFMPHGVLGIFTGTAVIFYSYLGFNNVTTLSEECVNPQRALPVGIIASLIFCSGLYIAMAAVMTGCVPYYLLKNAAPLAVVLQRVHELWLIPYTTIGAMAGLASTLLVGLYAQSRLAMRVAKDHLLPSVLGEISERFHTPAKAIAIFATLSSLATAFLPIEELAKMCNMATLAAFALVCTSLIILRRRYPDEPRSFRCPGSPVLPAAGVIASIGLMLSLPLLSWEAFLGWISLGLIVYMLYSHSRAVEA